MPRVLVDWTKMQAASGNLSTYRKQISRIQTEMLEIVNGIAIQSQSVATLKHKIRSGTIPKISNSAQRLHTLSLKLDYIAVEYKAAENGIIYSDFVAAAIHITGFFISASVDTSWIFPGLLPLLGLNAANITDIEHKKKILNIDLDANEEGNQFFSDNGLRKEYKYSSDKSKKKQTELHNILGVEKELNITGSSAHTDGSIKGDLGSLSYEAAVNQRVLTGRMGANFLSVDENGNVLFDPKIYAEIAASYTAATLSVAGQLGNENLGLYGTATVNVGKVAAEVGLSAGLFDEKGNVSPYVDAKIGGKAVLAELEGKAGVNFAGMKGGVTGSIGIGAGADAHVYVKDRNISIDASAYLGIGGELKADIDVSGAVKNITEIADTVVENWDTVNDTVKDVAEGLDSVNNAMNSTIHHVADDSVKAVKSIAKSFFNW
ncbi:MAG: hypothetical protein QM689_11380 [Oscillospiraceae bacterium]